MPLISLIEDNFKFVSNLGIPACQLSSRGNSKEEQERIETLIKEIVEMKYKIVYLTPEKFIQSTDLNEVLGILYTENKIDRFVIDEVHCMSQWGQDFRKDYLNLERLK